METCWVVDCGEIGYEESLELQKQLLQLRNKDVIPDILLLLEHPPTITLGAKATEDMLRIPRRVLEQRGIGVFDINRGGKATYHGPGQVVGYAIRAIDLHQLNAHLTGLEDTMLNVVNSYGIKGIKSYEVDEKHRRLPGVWHILNNKEYKLGSIGIEIKNGITTHGFALNINTNLNHFDFIDMCGFKDRGATSMQKLLQRPIHLNEIKQKLAQSFADIFKYKIEKKSYLSLKDAMNKFYSSSSSSL